MSTRLKKAGGLIWRSIREVIEIKDGIDKAGTIKEIKKGLSFRSSRVWILASSIVMASVGLNMASLAVIIGAMLVAPLMSPILGVGTSIATHDWPTLKDSLRGMGIAVTVSLVVSSAYFFLSPIKEANAELLSRTAPTILDIIIAIAGGTAGIISFSIKDKGLAATVIPGVAIGTALMPPLCTAGFGIAVGNFAYFIGAFYLFFLNALFIALPAFVFAGVFKFRKVVALDEATEKRYHRYLVSSVLLIIVPSVYLFIGVVKETVFNSRANDFVTNVVKYEGSSVIEYKSDYDDKSIEVFMIGQIVPGDVINSWENQIPHYNLQGAEVNIRQSRDATSEVSSQLTDQVKVEIIEELYKDKDIQLNDRDERIRALESELISIRKGSIPLISIEKEIEINYNKIQKFSYNQSMEMNFTGTIDTIPTFIVNWEDGYKDVESESKKLSDWLEARLKMDSVRVVNN